MKNNFLYFYAKRMMLVSALLLGVSEPLHAISVKSQKEADQSQTEQREKGRKKLVQQLSRRYKAYKKKLAWFNDCRKGRNCTKGEQRAAVVATILLVQSVILATVFGGLVGIKKLFLHKAKSRRYLF